MLTSLYNSYMLIDTVLLRDNITSILSSLPGRTKLIPVLKNDAFGLGLTRIASLCSGFREIGTLATAQIGEAVSLRRAGITTELLVMGGCPDFLNHLAVEYDLTLAAGRGGFVTSLAAVSKSAGKKAKVEIKIETGLNRIGFTRGDELDGLIRELIDNRDRIEVCGAFSHFADADDKEKTQRQYKDFLKGVKQLKLAGIDLPRIHISGSAAYEGYKEYSLDAVRIGRRLYMDNPYNPTGEIKEVASWRSYITNLRKLNKDDSLGYGNAYICDRDCLSATVGVGYADGLCQDLVRAKAPVLLNGKKVRLIGCCMDQCMLDVTDVDCSVGDEVTFFGYDCSGNLLSSQQVALIAGSNEGCGLTSALGARVERIYK